MRANRHTRGGYDASRPRTTPHTHATRSMRNTHAHPSHATWHKRARARATGDEGGAARVTALTATLAFQPPSCGAPGEPWCTTRHQGGGEHAHKWATPSISPTSGRIAGTDGPQRKPGGATRRAQQWGVPRACCGPRLELRAPRAAVPRQRNARRQRAGPTTKAGKVWGGRPGLASEV